MVRNARLSISFAYRGNQTASGECGRAVYIATDWVVPVLADRLLDLAVLVCARLKIDLARWQSYTDHGGSGACHDRCGTVRPRPE